MLRIKRTPLYNVHVDSGAKMVDFAGWEMPVYYASVIEEHMATRENAGLFDISHMGEIKISGDEAKKFLQYVMTNNIEKLENRKAQYTVMCNEKGGCVDDCFIYQFSEDNFMVVVNAANTEKDLDWMNKHCGDLKVKIEDVSDEYAKIDIQGPNAEEILQKVTDIKLSELKRFYFVEGNVADVQVIASRTGYTGEDGFEIYLKPDDAEQLWSKLVEGGAKPVGLGARDTLRIEACYSLYGHEINEEISPVEGSIGWVVKEKEFIGSDIVLKQKKDGADRKIVAFEMIDKGIPREHYKIFNEEEEVGFVTSGTFSPMFKKPLGLGLVQKGAAYIGNIVQIQIREKTYKAKIVKKPFYEYKQGGT